MLKRSRLLFVVGLAFAHIPMPVHGQMGSANGARPSFTVIAVQPTAPDWRGGSFIRMEQAGQWVARNQTLKALIAAAYNLTPEEISSGPAWVDSEHYDVVADALSEPWPAVDARMSMLQTILATHFKLTVHREQKEMPIYALTVAESGSKLKQGTVSLEKPSVGPPLFVGIVVFPQSLWIRGRKATMAELASLFQRPALDHPVGDKAQLSASAVPRSVLDGPVIDKTGLSGRYDFDLEFTPDATQFGGAFSDMSGGLFTKPSLFTAIQEQLGLKLESTKGFVETLVIDGIERPSKN